MPSAYLHVDALNPQPGVIAQAAGVLLRGGLVAFPTETVYGLGANALDSAAVEKIYLAKGRPSRNPLIVHVLDADQARQLCDWSATADSLAAQFWPGPLTLVLPRRGPIPDIVTGGGPTVALRSPAHPVARALIAAAGAPLAAPSANPSTAVSATRAEHVRSALDGKIDMILDGGQTAGGIESTVVSLVGDRPRLLRPGLVTKEQLEAVIGHVVVGADQDAGEGVLPSPGLLARHYAPHGQLGLAPDDGHERALELVRAGHRVGWLRLARDEASARPFAVERMKVFVLPADAAGYAARLYDVLHELNAWGADRIIVERPPLGEAWLAIHDRLTRAAAR